MHPMRICADRRVGRDSIHSVKIATIIPRTARCVTPPCIAPP